MSGKQGLQFTGFFVPGRQYEPLDLIYADTARGLYLVLRDYSGEVFDPFAEDTEGRRLQALAVRAAIDRVASGEDGPLAPTQKACRSDARFAL